MSLSEGDASPALTRERELWDAYVSRDRERIETLVDPLALDVGPSGSSDRERVIELVSLMQIDSYAIDDVHVLAHGDTEIVSYRATVDGTYRGVPFAARDVLCTSVWVRDGGPWRLAHRHESPRA